jgi:hypothetical protein
MKNQFRYLLILLFVLAVFQHSTAQTRLTCLLWSNWKKAPTTTGRGCIPLPSVNGRGTGYLSVAVATVCMVFLPLQAFLKAKPMTRFGSCILLREISGNRRSVICLPRSGMYSKLLTRNIPSGKNTCISPVASGKTWYPAIS